MIATKHHCREIARNLSGFSREGLQARNWTDAERYSRALVNRSTEAHALRAPDGKLLALYGVVEGGDHAGPWCLTSKFAKKFPILVLREAKAVLESWVHKYSLMIFFIHAKDDAGVRLAEHLGLNLGLPEIYAKNGGFFRRVTVQSKKLEVA